METKTEIRQPILTRVPPGDSWRFVNSDSQNIKIYTSLTKALDAWYQVTGETVFYVDAKRGVVETIEKVITTPVIEKYSLYGEK
jgi:hypothetical protein